MPLETVALIATPPQRFWVRTPREGPLVTDGHDTLFTASEVEALNSLSADHSVAKSLERGERLVCREELSVQVGNHLIHHRKERLPLLQL